MRSLLIIIFYTLHSNFALSQSLNSASLDVPYYSTFIESTDNLIIAGCRFNYLYDKSNLFIAKLNFKQKLESITDFDIGDTCIIHVGGVFLKDSNWYVFLTGVYDSPYLKANKWGFFVVDFDLNKIKKSVWFDSFVNDSNLGLDNILAKENENGFYGIVYADDRGRGIYRTGKPLCWYIDKKTDSLKYLYSDLSANGGDIVSLNDTLLFSISNSSASSTYLKYTWHDVKNNHYLGALWGSNQSTSTQILGVPKTTFITNGIIELFSIKPDTTMFFSEIFEELDNPNSLNIDSIRNPLTLQTLIGYYHFPPVIFNKDSTYDDPLKVFSPTQFILTEPRSPEIPNETFGDFSRGLTFMAKSKTVCYDKNRIYYVRAYRAQNLMNSKNIPVIKINCYDHNFKTLWERVIYTKDDNPLFGEVPFSLVSSNKGIYLISSIGNGNIISDDKLRLTYNNADIVIHYFDTLGFYASLIEHKLNIKTKISVYPNPASEKITIKTTSQSFILSIYNTLGKLLLQAINQHEIDISLLPVGVYTIVIDDGLDRNISKFMKE